MKLQQSALPALKSSVVLTAAALSFGATVVGAAEAAGDVTRKTSSTTTRPPATC